MIWNDLDDLEVCEVCDIQHIKDVMTQEDDEGICEECKDNENAPCQD